MAFNILKENTTNDLMKKLVSLYEKPLTSRYKFLLKQLFNMKISEGGFFTDHLNEFNTVTSHLSSVKVNFDDKVRPILIL